MCLVLLWYGAHPHADLILAGNRDEAYRRPSAPPALIAGDPRIWAGRDLEAGGTWMGRNEYGLVAAITNRHGSRRAVPPDVRSRGEIVMEVLRRRTAEQASRWVSSLPAARYRAFNLLFGSVDAFYYYASEENVPPRLLVPGFHALSNSTLDDVSWPKVARSHRFAEEHARTESEALVSALQDFLRDRTPPDRAAPASLDEEVHGALGAVFIDTPGYGTVSSSIITLGGRLGERYYFAEREEMRSESVSHPYRLIDR